MDIAIIGVGRIGLVAACCLAEAGHRVTGVETDQAKLSSLNCGSPLYEKGLQDLLKRSLASGRLTLVHELPRPLQAEVVMITVNTPCPAGEFDLTNVHAAVKQVCEVARDPLVMVMKSTVPPGTGVELVRQYLKGTPVTYVANPEFLRAGQAVDDWYHPSRIVIGSDNPQATARVRQLYEGIQAPIIETDITSAELIKHAANAYLTLKVSFINEVASLCQLLGADIDAVRQGLGLDPRIGTAFLQPGIGYGGPCLPKDARALVSLASRQGYDFKLIRAALEVNARQPVLVVDRMKEMLGTLKGKEIALLGLAFKPGTDDVTESPALELARLLIEGGARLRAYDPAAIQNARPLLTGDVTFAGDLYSAAQDACALILATEWPELIQADWHKIKKVMAEPYLVIDGRNALSREKLTAAGFSYMGVGLKI